MPGRARRVAMSVAANSLGARILALLAQRWPITQRQVALALQTREDAIAREVKRLVAQELVRIEPLGDDVYLALAGRAVRPVGPPPKPKDPTDPAFL